MKRLREHVRDQHEDALAAGAPPVAPGYHWRKMGDADAGFSLWVEIPSEDPDAVSQRYVGCYVGGVWEPVTGGGGLPVAAEPGKKPVGKTSKSASVREPILSPAFVGKPVGNSLPEPVGKPVGILVGKQASGQQKQQVARIEWFRHELDFRQNKKGGAWVLIRRRLRWSDTRYSATVVRQFCPQLSVKMIEQISVGKFSKATIAALQDGGIEHVFISDLQERIGKGNGRRKADLTEHELALLAGIESDLIASNRGRTDRTNADG